VITRRLAMKQFLAAGAGVAMARSLKAEEKPADTGAVVRGNTAFGLDLYGQLRSRSGNLFLSPFSISTALGMTYAGMRNRTAEQTAKALYFTLPPAELHAAFGKLQRALNAGDPAKRGYELSVANALWGQKGYPWKNEFLELTKENYGAGLIEVDFAAAEEARKTINAWVEKQTRDKIKDLIPSGVLDALTRLVLTNAIYFKGNWDRQFKKDFTRDADFFVAPDAPVKAPMMHQTGDYRLAQSPELQVLELPYVGKELAMLVLLPKKRDGLADLEKSLTAEKLEGWVGQLRNQSDLPVFLPRFKYTAEFQLNDALKALGMTDAFEFGKADFGGLNGGKEELKISAVLHKAFVDVNEEGTEAAAATAVVVKTLSARVGPVFRADHPFLFLIRDSRTGGVLFLGRVTDPTK
jgi:serine protease inhibitor